MSGQGQFNFVHVIITPLDYECNLVSLQCRKGGARVGPVSLQCRKGRVGVGLGRVAPRALGLA